MMKRFYDMIKDDLRRLCEYRIFHFIVVLSFLFSMAIALFPMIDPSNFIYITIFILPVIVFSISLFIEKEEKTLTPLLFSPLKTHSIVFSKIVSSLLVQLIPIFFFIIALLIVNLYRINYVLLFLAYFLGSFVHIIIGLSLSMISKTSKILSISYIGYIIVFSITPILFSNGIIPYRYQYIMIISPAYLSGVLIDNILAHQMYSSLWLILLSIGLQIVYSGVLMWFLIFPHFRQYLFSVQIEEDNITII
jgi:ABC-type Na+ efflux pump permease subunit